MAAANDVYLNTLCLAAWAPGPSTMKIAKAVVKQYDEFTPTELTMVTPINKLYVKLIKEVIDGKLDLSNRSEAQNTLMRYQDEPVFQMSKFSFQELKDMLTPTTLPGQTKIKQLYAKVRNHIVWQSNSRRLRMLLTANAKAGATDDPEKQKALLKQILEDAAEFTTIYNSQENDEESNTPVDEIDMADPDSIARALQNQHKKRSGSRIVFGWQAFNRMFGPQGGAAYGEFFACAARSHNYKSGMLMDMCRWHCVYNKPPDIGGKKALILFISLENEIGENLVMWYRSMYVNLYHKVPEGVSDDEIIQFVMREFSKNGFHLIVKRTFGDSFGYKEYVDWVEHLEKDGTCKVVATYLDYITLCHRCREDANYVDAKQLQMMVGRFKDFAQHRDMFFATGLQLETEAERLATSGQTDIVKKYGSSHLADSRGIKRELDILIFLEIENDPNGRPWLTVAWNKHKYVADTPREDKYFAVRFIDDQIGILDDINGKDTCSHNIYAEDVGDVNAASDAPISIF